jgi:hypothetical protein
MAIRYSDAATALQAGDSGLRRALSNASITFFTGTQPTSANDSYGSSQPIISFTLADGVLTQEVIALALLDFTGATGSETLTSITVSGIEVFGTTLTFGTTVNGVALSTATLFAEAVAWQINDFNAALDINAVPSGATVTLHAPKNTGIALNNAAIYATGTVVWNGAAAHMSSGAVAATETPNHWDSGNGRFGSGAGGNTAGVAAANGLTFNAPTNNTTALTYDLEKPSSQTWTGNNGYGPATASAATVFSGIVNGTTYTAGWGRILCSAGDDGSAATSGATGYIRCDFTVGTSGTDFIMSPAATFLVNTTTPIPTTINTFTLRVSKNLA